MRTLSLAVVAIVATFCAQVDARGVQVMDLFGVPVEDGAGANRHHHHNQHHHKSHRSGLKRDETGEEYMLCMQKNKKDGEEEVTRCKVSQESSMGVKGLGLACMAVFDEDNNALRQGCWIHQEDEVIMDACRSNSCVAEADGEGPYFCCCQGNLCNKDFSVEGAMSEKKRSPHTSSNDLGF